MHTLPKYVYYSPVRTYSIEIKPASWGGSKHASVFSAVTKQIGGLTAVNKVDLEIGNDQIVGLVGPNGAGKTTLLNIISGIIPPTSGKVSFCGEDITGMKPTGSAGRGSQRPSRSPNPSPT